MVEGARKHDKETNYQAYAAELELKLHEREEELKTAHRELESFIYTVSHDFRALLRAIMAAGMVLVEDYSDKLDEQGKTELQRQAIASRKMNGLLDELLKLSRLSRQEMTREQIDLAELARSAANDVGLKPGELSVAAGLTAYGDARLLRQALGNLFDNSRKFARPSVPLAVEVLMDGDKYVVRDNGIGFLPESADRIFSPFERLHTEAEYPGKGMGLATVKRILDRHEGRIFARSNPGEGASFIFTLPKESS